MSFPGWNVENESVAMGLWGEGASASQIPRAIGGVSRNAVSAKLRRMNAPRRAPAAAPGARTTPVPRKPRAEPPRPRRSGPNMKVASAIDGARIARAARVVTLERPPGFLRPGGSPPSASASAATRSTIRARARCTAPSSAPRRPPRANPIAPATRGCASPACPRRPAGAPLDRGGALHRAGRAGRAPGRGHRRGVPTAGAHAAGGVQAGRQPLPARRLLLRRGLLRSPDRPDGLELCDRHARREAACGALGA